MSEHADYDLITTREAADLLGATQGAVRMAILTRDMPVVSTSTTRHGHYRLDRAAVLDWAATHTFKEYTPRHSWVRTRQALEVLGNATADEIAAYRGIHPGNVRKHLSVLAEDGSAQRGRDGRWSLIVRESVGAA